MTRKQYGGLIGALLLVLSIYDATLGLTIRGGMLGIVLAQVSSFLALNDTPDSYVGQALKLLTVKSDESGVEFTTPPASDEKVPVTLATTGLGDITLSGEQTIDGTLTSATPTLVDNQANPAQNGLYITSGSAWVRRADADTGAEFAGQWNVFVLSGTRNGGSRCTNTNTTAVTLNTTAITFSCDPGAKALTPENYDTPLGVARLRSDTKLNPAQMNAYAAHVALSNPNQITVTARTMGIQCDTGTCDLTSNPQVSLSGLVAHQLVTFVGTDPTKTVKLDHGNGLTMCGGQGSVIIGSTLSSPTFKVNTGVTALDRVDCQDSQAAHNVGNTIVADETRPVKVCNAAGTSCWSRYVDSSSNNPTDSTTCAGAGCDEKHIISAGKTAAWYKSDGTTPILTITESTGAVTGPNLGRPLISGHVLSNVFGSGFTCSSGGSDYYGIPYGETFFGSANPNGAEIHAAYVLSKATTIANLYVKTSANVPSGETITITLRKNAASTALTCAVAAGTSTCSNTNGANAVSFVAGDTTAWLIRCAGGTTDPPTVSIGANTD